MAAHPQSHRLRSPKRLYSLPLELRQIIYRFVLERETPVFFPRLCVDNALPAIPLLQVSRSVRSEALNTIFLHIPVLLETPLNLTDLRYRLKNKNFCERHQIVLKFPRNIYVRPFTSWADMYKDPLVRDILLKVELQKWREYLGKTRIENLRSVVFDFSGVDEAYTGIGLDKLLRILMRKGHSFQGLVEGQVKYWIRSECKVVSEMVKEWESVPVD